METLKFLNQNIFWGPPMLFLMLLTGIILTFKTRGFIFLKFGFVLKNTLFSLFKRDKEKGISPISATLTAMAGTVGTGNIMGVALAIRQGGPGAIFWMWVASCLGMVIKYAEVSLSIRFRKKDGELFKGGPMYYMEKGLLWKKLPLVFAFFTILSSFGIGNMVQSNSLSLGACVAFGFPEVVSGVLVSLFCALVLIGGVKKIFSFCEKTVIFMSIFYIGLSVFVLFLNYKKIPDAFLLIFSSAFSSASMQGGFLGASVAYAIRIGVSRGLFTNEAGLGSAPIAHASASVLHPSIQGMWGAFEVFFDTIILCTLSALCFITTGAWCDNLPDEKIFLLAFSQVPYGERLLGVAVVLFAFASIIAWYYYGRVAWLYIFGERSLFIYRIIYVFLTFIGAVIKVDFIWEIADILNSPMAFLNLCSLLLLSGEVSKITNDFIKK